MTTRALGYVRVSTAREDMISPELQVSAIRDHCARHGYHLVDVHADLDQSGRSFARAEVQRIVERVEAGDAEVVVVWKVSRFGRTRRDWYVHADRLEVVGGRLESATEGFDAATSVGKFTRGMLVELAAFESDRIGDVWREVQGSRIKQGLTHNGRARFGYTYDRDAGVHRPNPDTGPVLAECYRRYVAGEGVYRIVGDLNRRGITTTTGALWSDRTLRRVLDSGFAAGYVTYGGQLHGGAHEAIVSSSEWQAYLDAKTDRARRVPPRSVSSPYLLSGLVVCARCDGRMIGNQSGPGRTPMYRCETRRSTAGAGCDAPYVPCDHAHAAVFAWLEGVAADVDEAAGRAAVLAAELAVDRTGDADRLAREVTRLEAALVRLAQNHAEDAESDPVIYRAARADYTGRLDAARTAHADAVRDARQIPASPGGVAAPLVDEWDTLGVEGRRAALRGLVRSVRVVTYDDGTAADVVAVPSWGRM